MASDKRRRGGYGFSFNLTGPGTAFTLGMIAIAIGFGILLSKGAAPSTILSDPGQTGDIERVIETPDPAQKGLQLKTLKFQECASTITIDLLLDRSGSMSRFTPSGVAKISRLVDAVGSLLEKAQDSSIIGIQSFSYLDSGPSITDDVPISYYSQVKNIIPARLAALSPDGATPTHDALAFSYEKLKEAIPKFPPDRKFNFIFISDGAPCPGIANPCNATGPNQDPRLYTPNPADQIKNLGVKVYTLGIYSVDEQSQKPFLEDLLKSIASSPDNYYAADSGDDVKRLLQQITNKICNAQVTPTSTQ